MSLLPASRSWVPGAALLAAATAAAVLTGLALGVRSLVVYAGLASLVLLAMGALERFTVQRAPQPPKARGRLKARRGGHEGRDYDLAADESTNNQRYLM